MHGTRHVSSMPEWKGHVHRPYATSTSEHSVSIGIGAAHRRPGRGYMFGV